MLRSLAEALTARKQELYELSYETGQTKGDAWIDIDGGIGTLAVYQSKGRRELPNKRILIDGNLGACLAVKRIPLMRPRRWGR